MIELRFTTPNRYPTDADAKAARDAEAKRLRAEGYTVKCKKFSFAGLGYGSSFVLTAFKQPQGE